MSEIAEFAPIDSLDDDLTYGAAADELGALDPEPAVVPDAETPHSAPAAKTNNRALIRKVALKAQELLDAPTSDIGVAAVLLGTGTDLVDMTTAIMSAPRSVLNPLNDIKRLAEASQMDAVVEVVMLDRARIKGLWSVLAAVDAVKKSALAASDPKAAPLIVKAIHALSTEAQAQLDGAAALLRKS